MKRPACPGKLYPHLMMFRAIRLSNTLTLTCCLRIPLCPHSLLTSVLHSKLRIPLSLESRLLSYARRKPLLTSLR